MILPIRVFTIERDNLLAFDLDNYDAPSEYRPFLDEIKLTHRARQIPFWDTSDQSPLPEFRYEDYMENNLVHVGFTLTFDNENGLESHLGWVSILN